MRSDPTLRHIPILVVSGEGGIAVDGADVVLSKPCTSGRLCNVVDQLLARQACS
jgi:hypothetical protein